MKFSTTRKVHKKFLYPTFCILYADMLFFKCKENKKTIPRQRRNTVYGSMSYIQDIVHVEWWKGKHAAATKRGAVRRGSFHHVQGQEIKAVAGLINERSIKTMAKTQITYRRISESDRHKIEVLYNKHVPIKEIAKILGFSKVSIYAEIKRGLYMHRNHDWTETKKYSADKAQRNAAYNQTSKGAHLKLGNDYEFVNFVEKMILSGYSPEATLNYIKENNIEFKTKICRVTLYSYIDKGLFMNISNKNLLRKANKKLKKKKVKKAKKIVNPLHSIELRPERINDRSEFGHWELDTVIGRRSKGKTLLVFTEIFTRYSNQ